MPQVKKPKAPARKPTARKAPARASASRAAKGESLPKKALTEEALEKTPKQKKPQKRTNARVPLNLALQGGGAHGAYSWGVLDALLESDCLDFDGVSGTSAGGVNAVLLADGLARGGVEGARKILREFWTRLGGMGAFYSVPSTGLEHVIGAQNMSMTKSFLGMDWMSHYLSPYQLNPFDVNPLRNLLADIVDFDRVKRQRQVRLFINATNVRDGKIKVFETKDISLDVILASACLPLVFKAVEIDGEAYWDGGYSGNPAIFPLIYSCAPQDILLVQVNPIAIDYLPTTASEINDRISDISFNATLMREMRAIAFVSKLIKQGKVKDDEYKDIRMHRIASDAVMRKYDAASKLLADTAMIENLFKVGREAALSWLKTDFPKVGKKATLDIRAEFL